MKEYLAYVWDFMVSSVVNLNDIGLPVPLILITVVFYFLNKGTRKWSDREKYYYILIASIGKLKDSLNDSLTYYLQPGSEYQEAPTDENYKELEKICREQLRVIADNLHVAKLFLSANTIEAIENLQAEHWVKVNVDYHCEEDYLQSVLSATEIAYKSIIQNAKEDFSKHKVSAFLQTSISKGN